MYILIVGALLAVVLSTPVHAQVHVDIGIHFPAPPPLVVVPGVPRVQYVPNVPAEPANLFLYNGQYWAFANDNWYVGPGYNGVRPAQAFTARAQAGYLGCEQCASSSMAAGFAEGERNLVRR